MRRIIVVAADQQAAFNQGSQQVDTDGWQKEMSVPLRKAGDATNTVVAYWCSWEMTDATRQTLDAVLATEQPTAVEAHVYGVGETLPAFGTQRIWLIDGDTVSPEQVLADLGLDVLS